MPQCHYSCPLRAIKHHATNQLNDLNEVREDLKDLLYHEPDRKIEIREKSRVICEKIAEKLAKFRHITYCIERGCDSCYENGARYE